MKLRIIENFKEMDAKEKRIYLSELLINNSLYIFLVAAIILIQCMNPRFLSWPSIVNIVSLSAANLPIALGIAGAIILTGTDLSAGRIVGLVACVSAALLQITGYAGKMFPAGKRDDYPSGKLLYRDGAFSPSGGDKCIAGALMASAGEREVSDGSGIGQFCTDG